MLHKTIHYLRAHTLFGTRKIILCIQPPAIKMNGTVTIVLIYLSEGEGYEGAVEAIKNARNAV